MASNNVIIALLFLIYQLFSSEPQCSASDLFHPLKQFVFSLEVFDLQVAVGLDAVLGQGREQANSLLSFAIICTKNSRFVA